MEEQPKGTRHRGTANITSVSIEGFPTTLEIGVKNKIKNWKELRRDLMKAAPALREEAIARFKAEQALSAAIEREMGIDGNRRNGNPNGEGTALAQAGTIPHLFKEPLFFYPIFDMTGDDWSELFNWK
jgi:hypothetical protein